MKIISTNHKIIAIINENKLGNLLAGGKIENTGTHHATKSTIEIRSVIKQNDQRKVHVSTKKTKKFHEKKKIVFIHSAK